MLKTFIGEGFPPAGFDAIKISLPMQTHANLKWEKDRKWALNVLEKGFSIVWDLEMDLFKKPIFDAMELNALTLALEHFSETLFLEFEKQTKGFILFSGPLDERFDRGILEELLIPLPEEVPPFLLFEEIYQKDVSQLLSLEHFKLGVKRGFAKKFPLALSTFGWEHGNSHRGYFSREFFPPIPEQSARIGVLDFTIDFDSLEKPFKLIAEENLTKEWDGLEALILPPQLSSQGQRKVAGFIAAQGTILNV